jgi:photosystem II stability/assembly factor-like uncharacterized protein
LRFSDVGRTWRQRLERSRENGVMMAALETRASVAGHPAVLVLEDGSVFCGQSLGAEGEWVGEVVVQTPA